MRFILVNGRNPDGECAFCHLELEKSYVRDLCTGIVYHNPYCLEAHINTSIILIEGNDVQHIEIR